MIVCKTYKLLDWIYAGINCSVPEFNEGVVRYKMLNSVYIPLMHTYESMRVNCTSKLCDYEFADL